jgi:hypothetical protein
MKKQLYELYKLEKIKKQRCFSPAEEKEYNNILSHLDNKALALWNFFHEETDEKERLGY